MSETNNEPIDVSWMWHCACAYNPKKNVLDYSMLTDDKILASQLTTAAESGFRLALRKMEDLGLIVMSDINRKPNEKDQKTWDDTFGKLE